MVNVRKDFEMAAISDCGFDDVYYVDHILQDGRANLKSKVGLRPGGTAVNFLTATKLFGGRLAVGGVVGDDAAGDALRTQLDLNGLNTDYLLESPGRTTIVNMVLQAQDGRYIVRAGSARIRSLIPRESKAFLSLVARSESVVVGHVPVSLTNEMTTWARRHETFIALVPGYSQLRDLSLFQADALFLNANESRRATGLPSEASAEVAFTRLVQLTPALRIVQTGGGTEPTFTLDRVTSQTSAVPPIMAAVDNHDQYGITNGCGCGDVTVAGTLHGLLKGDALETAYASYGRPVATAHLHGVTFGSVVLISHTRRYSQERPNHNTSVLADVRLLAGQSRIDRYPYRMTGPCTFVALTADS